MLEFAAMLDNICTRVQNNKGCRIINVINRPYYESELANYLFLLYANQMKENIHKIYF